MRTCACGRADVTFRRPYGCCKRCEADQAKARRAAKRSNDFEITEIPPEPPTAPSPPPVSYAPEAVIQRHTETVEKRDVKRENGALVAEVQRQEKLIAELGRMNAPIATIVYSKPAWERSDATACAIASDWHIEEPVVKEAVHGLNEYNLEIARSRAEFFFKNTLRLANMDARESTIRTIFMSFLGDFISGWIHEELLANTLLAPGDAANFCAGLICGGIDFLLKESSYQIVGDMIPGNHGRMTHKMHMGNPTGTSLETFMYRMIAMRYQDNPRVQLTVSPQAMVYRDFYERFKLRQIHGYEVKYGGGIGGLTIPLRKALANWNNPIRADLTVLGHFHTLDFGGDYLVNGSLIGYNNFAQAIKAKWEEARQAFYLIHARHGGEWAGLRPIWLNADHKETP